MAPSNALKAHGATSSTPATTCPTASTSSNPSSMPSHIASITSDPTKPLAIAPQPSTSQNSAPDNPSRLICPEPGQPLDSLQRASPPGRGQPEPPCGNFE